MSKYLIAFLTIFCFTDLALGQDTIVLRNGDEIKAKIAVIDINEIQYHRFDNLTGPLYIAHKADVFMIKFENGVKELFSNAETPAPATESPSPRPYKKPTDSYVKLQKKASGRITAGAILTGAGGALLVAGIPIYITGIKNGGQFNNGIGLAAGSLMIIAGIASTIVGPILLRNGFKYRRLANNKALLGFVPVNGTPVHRFDAVANYQTLTAVTLTF